MTKIGSLQILAILLCATALAIVPIVANMLSEPFYITLLCRVLIFAIAAVSLDFILGYAGLVSFGHAAYFGIGAYVVGVLGLFEISNGFVHVGCVIVSCAVTAYIVGLVALRTTNVYFIMITLAFAQMFYFVFISMPALGGDDGLSVAATRFQDGLHLSDPTTLYYASLGVLAACLFGGYHVVRSRFGMVMRASRTNDRRLSVMGFHSFGYRLTAYVISAAVCGVAGLLFANLTSFVSPAVMHWTRSGELLVMVVIGGVGTLFGPVLGAALYLLFEEIISGWTKHWAIFFGPLLVGVVMFAKGGLFGLLDRKRSAPKVGA